MQAYPYECPASPGQRRLWFIDRAEGGGAAYNTPVAIRLEGDLDLDALRRALTAIVGRHDALRTALIEREGELLQRVEAPGEVPLPVTEVSPQDGEAALHAEIAREISRPFDLARSPLFRSRLFRLSPREHVLAITSHHTVFDGWSEGILLHELDVLYGAFSRGEPSPLEELPLQFSDFTEWQREELAASSLENRVAYWEELLVGLTPTELPADRARGRKLTFNGRIRPFTCSTELAGRLKQLALAQRTTLFSVTGAAFLALLSRMARQDDLAVGITAAGRNHSEVEPLIGYFTNTLVLRASVRSEQAFTDLVTHVQDRVRGAFLNQDLQFERLVELARVPRDPSRTPLFQVLFNQAPTPAVSRIGNLALTRLLVDPGIAKFDLSLYLGESDNGLGGFFEYNTDLFESASIERLVAAFECVLEGIVAAPETPVAELPLLPPAERDRIIVEWNRAERDYPRDRTVIDLFTAQAAATGEAPAARMGETVWTYDRLAAEASRIARLLRARGVGPGVLVGVCLERSLEMLASVLGILQAGGAYVPLDPAFPAERLAFMLDDAEAPVVVTQQSLRSLVERPGIELVEIDRPESFDAVDAGGDVTPQAQPDDLAYVLYTSGSTGKPKGVEIPHRALTNFLWAMRTEPGCAPGDTVLAITTLSFDIAGLELFLPLVTGSQVEIAPRAMAVDGRALRDRLDRGGITILQATPASWRMLLEAGWQGSPGLKALIGGEPLPADLLQPLLERTASLWNMYGPTETTIWSSVRRMTPADVEITVGRPIANTTFYILDDRRQPVPVGVAGELYIGGDSVARGYRGRPELTAERFLPDPFRPGQRIYRTGDLAKYRADGEVIHLGRLDHQVKIRGFRIELGEIEAALGQHPAVREAAVVVRQDRPGQERLVAYLVPRDTAPSPAELRQHLQQTLPDYMVPSRFVTLEALPLTPNGKIDRKRLPAPAEVAEPKVIVAPRTPAEEQVAAVFREVLELPEVSVDADFFELGGQSLLAIRLVSRLEARLQTHVPLSLLFEVPTIAGLAARLYATAAPQAPARVVRQPRVAVRRPQVT